MLLLSIWFQPVGRLPAIIAAALVIATVARPFYGLLMLAGVGPLATILLIVARRGTADLRFSEALILAFVAGWAAERAIRPRPLALSEWLLWSAIPLIAAALASAAISFARYAAQQPGTATASAALEVLHTYLSAAIPLTPSMLFAEGLVVLLIAADACAGNTERRDALLRMMVAGAAGAALINILRIVLAAASRDHPWSVAFEYFWSVRVNVHYPDLNAAGSYFAMMTFIAGALVWEAFLPWIFVLLLIVAGLWLSGSRTALAAAIGATIAGLGVLATSRRRRGTVLLGVSGIVIVAIVTGVLWRQYPREKNAAPSAAWQARVSLAKGALEMAADHAVFGVGLGRFFELSPEYVSIPQLAAPHENAHNNFLQVLAELGAPGLLLFLTVIALGVCAVARTPEPSPTTYGLLMGLAVFLLTCVGGHPLLVHGATYPFWMALGIAAAERPQGMNIARWPRIVGLALLAVVVVTLPHRIVAGAREADLEGASVGLSKWQHAPDGTAYRWAGAQAALFVPSTAKWVEIPLRHGPGPAEGVHVRLMIDGRQADTILLPNDGQWHMVRLLLVRRVRDLYSRIDLQVQSVTRVTPLDGQTNDMADLLMVGKPVLPE